MSLVDLSCKSFVEELASTAPFPGGGGACAYAGALGAALGAMAGNISYPKLKAKDSEKEKELNQLLKDLKELQEEFICLIDEDAKAFEPLSKAYKIPKEDKNKEKIMLNATLTALLPPMKIMRASCRAIELLEKMYTSCSKMLISDVACGSLLCMAALEAASMNVFINTGTLTDIDKKKEFEEEADKMLNNYLLRARELSKAIKNELRS